MADDLNRFKIEMSLERLKAIAAVPEWGGFVRDLDAALDAQIRQMPHIWQWYVYFDRPSGFVHHLEPTGINPREFLYFWSTLTWEDELLYKLYTPAEFLRGK